MREKRSEEERERERERGNEAKCKVDCEIGTVGEHESMRKWEKRENEKNWGEIKLIETEVNRMCMQMGQDVIERNEKRKIK